MDEISTAQFCCKPSKSHHKGNKIKWYLYLRRKFLERPFLVGSFIHKTKRVNVNKNTVSTTYVECQSQIVCISTWASFEAVINIQWNKVFLAFLFGIQLPLRKGIFIRSNLVIMMLPCITLLLFNVAWFFVC